MLAYNVSIVCSSNILLEHFNLLLDKENISIFMCWFAENEEQIPINAEVKNIYGLFGVIRLLAGKLSTQIIQNLNLKWCELGFFLTSPTPWK